MCGYFGLHYLVKTGSLTPAKHLVKFLLLISCERSTSLLDTQSRSYTCLFWFFFLGHLISLNFAELTFTHLLYPLNWSFVCARVFLHLSAPKFLWECPNPFKLLRCSLHSLTIFLAFGFLCYIWRGIQRS